MIWFACDNIYGRLANQLYALLYVFALSKNAQNSIKLLLNRACYDFNLEPILRALNMQDLYGAKEDIKPNDKLLVNDNKKIEEYYHQRFNVDFTLNDIEEFARNTILQSDSLKFELDYLLNSKIDPVSKSAAIHIRNTDYLTSTYNWFDRQKYIVDAIAWMHNDHREIDKLVVFSDDISLSKNQFDSIFSKQFKTTIYLEPDKDDSIQSSTLKDFLRLALFKHKILFNSSFSTFSAYVGNVIYPNSFRCVYAPAFDYQDKFSDRNNYLWNLVPQQPRQQ